MNWIDIIGTIGIFLFLAKIIVHIYLKLQVDKKFYVGASGHFLNPELFIPILDDFSGTLKVVKKVFNIVYVISVTMIVFFAIAKAFFK